ncbi:hypothetical protein MAR_019042 [Mya arenaria]|uniref:Uncharacterized protein n=1 Tax=Mya arenaria TaxID=6604 RepID=A0ABY7EJA2_MYAAR|nr:hypothetical protein MAR_019042 [Mya arenaria]
MAGLGEVCTHVASLMFSIDETVRLRDARTRTEDPNWWIIPSAVKGVSYSMIKDIDFTSMRSLKRKYENVGGDIPSYPQSSTTQKHLKDVPTPTDAELNGFFSKLSATGRNPAILSVVKEFSDDYVPKQDKMDLPAPLGNLKTKDAMMMNYGQLVNHCAGIQLTVSKDQIANVEDVTRNQSETSTSSGGSHDSPVERSTRAASHFSDRALRHAKRPVATSGDGVEAVDPRILSTTRVDVRSVTLDVR